MLRVAVRQFTLGHAREPSAALEALLARLRTRLYPETLPALASCWLNTVCAAGHNRSWWEHIAEGMTRALAEDPLEPPAREALVSTLDWIRRTVLAGGQLPARRQDLQPPFRSFAPERLVPYIARLLNEWLPAEIAYLLTEEEPGAAPDPGIPALSVAKVLHRILVRERLSPETLERFLAPGLLSPKLVYPADFEVLHDVVLALLGRVAAPDFPVLPAELLGVAANSALPADYADAVRRASIEHSPDAGEELHVPISDADALAVLSHDPVQIGSVVVTMDGRSWEPWTLCRGEESTIVYRPAAPLRIDCTADHAKLTVRWPEAPSSWSGAVPMRGPFQMFGREWRASSWELDAAGALLHLTFSRTLPVAEPPVQAPASAGHLRPAYVDMAWSELERALAEAVPRRSLDPVEQMRRSELIPLGRALYALAESVLSAWPLTAGNVETRLKAARYHQASVPPAYGRVPWRVLPADVRTSLARRRLSAASFDSLVQLFDDVKSTSPSQAA